MKQLLLAVAIGTLWLSPAMADSLFDDESLRVGAGFGSIEADGAAAGTVQVFAGVDAMRSDSLHGGLEVGLLDVSDSSEDSGWIAGFLARSMAPDVDLFGRAGLDFGPPGGWLLGAGVGYFIEHNMEVRMEVALREQGTGVQFNLAWYPNRSFYYP